MRLYARSVGDGLFLLGGPQGESGEKKHSWTRNKLKFNAWQMGQVTLPLTLTRTLILTLTLTLTLSLTLVTLKPEPEPEPEPEP